MFDKSVQKSSSGEEILQLRAFLYQENQKNKARIVFLSIFLGKSDIIFTFASNYPKQQYPQKGSKSLM
jgi:hypothetical protein